MGAAASNPEVVKDHEVAAFLTTAGLQVYVDRMVQSGFDDMETLLAIEESDMKALGFSTQHAALLKRKLQEHQGATMDENHPVVVFLKDIGLSQYAEGLIKNGWDDMETLLMIDDEGMKELGIPRGHVLKLKKRLREYQENLDAKIHQQALQSKPFPSRTSSSATTATYAPSRASSAASICSEFTMEAHLQVGGPRLLPPGAATPQTIAYSWDQVQQLGAGTVARCLYENMMRLAPESVELFRDENGTLQADNLQRLFAKFVKYVGCTVAGYYDTQRLLHTLSKLGALKVAAGVTEAHWKILGQVLDMTLHQLLGSSYTPEVQRAWMTAYQFMSSIMVDGFHLAVAGDAGSSSEDNVES